MRPDDHRRDRASQLLARVGVLLPVVLDESLHRPRAQRVVGDDRVVGDAEYAEQHRREDACAILARAAVKERRIGVRVGKDRERLRDRRLAGVEHRAVLRRDDLGVDPVGECVGVGQHIDHRQVELDRIVEERDEASALVDLVGSAQVDHGRQIERPERGDVVSRQRVRSVGAVQPLRQHPTVVARAVPAEITEVEATVEPNLAFESHRRDVHTVTVRRPLHDPENVK